MRPFQTLTAFAAPLRMANVDTDKILPARFLKTISRDGLGQALFASLRDDPDFILSRVPWNEAGILVTLGNFGCGSSREHAPWALLDFGIRCIIAPSMADIFYNNCFKNGILPILLPDDEVDALLALAGDATTARMTVDLPAQTIATVDGQLRPFNIEARRLNDLVHGVDEITRSLARGDDIDFWERRCLKNSPWLNKLTDGVLQQGSPVA